MESARLLFGLLLPWALGIAAMLVIRDARRPLDAAGELAWCAGTGYLIGALALTLWMRALSLAGIRFGAVAIALPLLAATAALGVLGWRRHGGLRGVVAGAMHSLLAPSGVSGTLRYLWLGLLAWLALRFALLGYEVALRPLYPWDAWIEWATKARVYFEFGTIVPFLPADTWMAANGAAWFDASPQNPVTLPLLQTWTCIALGRWDDALMNWPWWQFAVALTLFVYGGLCRQGLDRTCALIGAYLAASLPLVGVHVALAGYADLPLAIYLVAAVLVFMRWVTTRAVRDLGLVVLFAAACPLIKTTGAIWALTLIPGFAMALLAQRGPKLLAGGLGLAMFLVAVLAQTQLVVAGHSLHLDFAPAWSALGETYLLFANWHLLWYGFIGVAILAWRHLLAPPLAPLTAIVVAGLFFVLTLFFFPGLRFKLVDPPTLDRATLHLAPMIVVYILLSFHAFAATWTTRHATPSAPPAAEQEAPSASADQAPEAPPAGQAV